MPRIQRDGKQYTTAPPQDSHINSKLATLPSLSPATEPAAEPDFEDVFYKHNYAANMKLVSYYMLYGYVDHTPTKCTF